LYQKPYAAEFDLVSYPTSWSVPHYQYIAQLGEVNFSDALRVQLFSLSLTGTAFSWFSSLAPNSIQSWNQLERKFHDHFYSGDNETKLTNLTSVKQGRDESVTDYFKRFKDIKYRCFSLSISEKDLWIWLLVVYIRIITRNSRALIFFRLIKWKLEYKFKNSIDTYKTHRSNTDVVDCESDSLDDEEKEVYAAEFVWPSKAKSYSFSSRKPTQKNWQEEVRFTFDVSKCDRRSDELLKNGNIKLSHAIPLLEELRRRAYCKWHNSSSHATNDCNVFR
jgi:hypothetical protein